VIPVHDGEETIGDALAALCRSCYRDMEVIVVDDGSRDRSAAIAGTFPVAVERLSRNRGPAGARNHGTRIARGELLLFLDADVIVEPDTVERMVAALDAEPDAAALFCSFGTSTAPGNFVSDYKNLLHHHTHQHARRDAATFCAGFGAIHRDELRRAGGFDPRLRFLEDIDLGYRLHRSGRRIVLDPSIQVTHAKRYSLLSLVRSDLGGRAIPWTRLMLRHRVFRSDLNTRGGNVASVVLAWLVPLGLAVGAPVGRRVLVPASALGLVLANRSFIRFLRDERGLSFAAASLPILWLGYLYSGAGFGAGIASHLRRP
jgi:glycosyltransferase involved in cell wall biosynthesis